MHDTRVMDRAQSATHLDGNLQRDVECEPGFGTDHLTQVRAIHELHGDVAHRAVLPVLMNAADVDVTNAARQPDLREKPNGEGLVISDRIGGQHLQSDDFFQDQVVRPEYCAHAAGA